MQAPILKIMINSSLQLITMETRWTTTLEQRQPSLLLNNIEPRHEDMNIKLLFRLCGVRAQLCLDVETDFVCVLHLQFTY